MTSPLPSQRGIHRLAVFLAAYVVLLITAGGLVKSLEAGLSVPDWPLSYGMLNPPRWWQIETVRAEHGHRLIAGVALLVTLTLVVWIARREPRTWVRRMAFAALAAVVAQAVLGGVTVLLFLPPAVSVAHAALAQLFLAQVVTLAVVTSRFWTAARDFEAGGADRGIATLAIVTAAGVFAQILIGAVMRHTGAGLAIPDFPLAFGGLLPPRWDFGIGIHFAHRVGALVVATLVFWSFGRILRVAPGRRALVIPAALLVLIVLAQGTLGGLVVLTARQVLPNTMHVGVGALLLAASTVLLLVSQRLRAIPGRRARRATPSPVERLEPERARP